MRAETAASFRPITSGGIRRMAKPAIWAGSAARGFARALTRRYDRSVPRPVLPMIHRHRRLYGRILLRVLSPRYHIAWQSYLYPALSTSGSRRRLATDRSSPLVWPVRTHRERRPVERIRATARTIIERSTRVEILARPAVRVPRTVPQPETGTVPRGQAPAPGWAQPPPMLVARQRIAGRSELMPAHSSSGATAAHPAAAATSPLRWAEPATGGLPLGRLQIERLTEEVIRSIDRRFVSLRER